MSEINWRYERKFLVDQLSYSEIISIIKLHPAFFSEIYRERQINNIYLDSPDFENYQANEMGVMDRTKYRIRWYGEEIRFAKNPGLEMKIKSGWVGTKRHFKLNDFPLNKMISLPEMEKMIEGQEFPDDVRQDFLSIYPAIVNGYKRKYFLTADGKYRLTVDREIYSSPALQYGNFIDNLTYHEKFIIELKYDKEDDKNVHHITSKFPFRLTKSSKYASAIEFHYS